MEPKAPRARYRARRWREDDIGGIVECHQTAYAEYRTFYTPTDFARQRAAFPEGQFLVTHRGRVVGYATSLIVQLDEQDRPYTYQQLTGSGTFSSHTPSGDTLYGADIAVHPDFRRRGVSSALYERRLALLRRLNLRRMVAYGRLTGYHEYAGVLTAEEYIEACMTGEIEDPALRAHLKIGYQVKGVHHGLVVDGLSLDYATWLELPNPSYRPARRRIAAAPLRRPVRRLRVCAGQFQMRRIKDWPEFTDYCRFFVDAAEEYNAHLLLLPELFTAALLTANSPEDEIAGMRKVAGFHDAYVSFFTEMATRSRLYIVAGSTPVLRDGVLYNVAHLFTPSGAVHSQDKLHITPSERSEWGIRPGRGLKVFETPIGRFGILICYDVEFPELARLQTLAGAEVILVPFSTDDQKAYQRVRYTAAARAVENLIYVVLAGNVGNLPARNYMLNYGRAAVLTPSDVGFPPLAIAAEADHNLETVIFADLDFAALSLVRDMGNVRPLRDRREDLYNVRAREPVEIVSTE